MNKAQQLHLAILEAHEQLQANEHNWLPPFYRYKIYNALLDIGGLAVINRLNYISVLHVLDIWKQVWPEENNIHLLLNAVLDHLAKPISEERYRSLNHQFYYIREDYLSTDEEGDLPFSLEERAGCVFAAAYATLVNIDDSEYWYGTSISEETDEGNIPLEETDPAAWCAFAKAGSHRVVGYEPEQSLTFWQWWLNHAIPEALEHFDFF